MQYTLTWRNKFLTTEARSIGEMAQVLEDAAQELRQMERDGVTLDPGSGVEHDYALLVTADEGVARKYGFEEEDFDEDDEEDADPEGEETADLGCHDCGARPGTLHERDCDVEQCPACGGQFVSCECPARLKKPRLPWTGEWPGEADAREFGWYAKQVPGVVGWVPCEEGDPGAELDLNRLHKEARWDRRAGRFVRRA